MKESAPHTSEDALLDEHLRGGSAVSQRYRELDHAEVPAELDQRVLATARAAVGQSGKAGSFRWKRWSAPVALAASAVLAVTVVIENGLKNEVVLTTPASAPAPRPQAPAEVAEQTFAAEKMVDAQRKREESMRRSASEGPQLQPAPPTVAAPASPPSEPPDTELAKQHVRGNQAFDSSADSTAAVPAEAAAAARAPAMETAEVRAPQRRQREADAPSAAAPASDSFAINQSARGASAAANEADPAAWLERIRELRRQGQADGADLEWRRFLEIHPDYEVAQNDQARP